MGPTAFTGRGSARAWVERMHRYHVLVGKLAEAVTLSRVAAVVATEAARTVGARGATVVMYAPDGVNLRVVSATEAGDGFEPGTTFGPEDDVPYWQAIRTGERVGLDRERFPAGLLDPDPDVGGWLAVPLVARRRTLGVLAFTSEEPLLPTRDHDVFLETVALQCAVALDRATLHDAEAAWRAELDQRDDRFRSLVQELGAIFWEADPETVTFDFVSRRAEDLLGYPTGRWSEPGFWASIIHPDDRQWAVEFCSDCTRDGQDHVFEYRLVAADGRTVWVRDVVYVDRDADGNPKKLLGVMFDVTGSRTAHVEDRPHARVLGADAE